RIVAGDSRSFGRYRVTLFLLFVNTILWGIALPLTLNGAFDHSPATDVHGVVTATQWDSDDGQSHVDVRWESGDISSHTLSGNVSNGSPVTGKRHPGAFGMPWLERGRSSS